MKGQPSTAYTANKHRWLRELAAHPGTKRSGKGSPAYSCMTVGWTTWEAGGVAGHRGEVLTEAGRAQLEEWDRVHGDPPPAAPSAGAVEPFAVRIGRALKPDGLEALADWLVLTGLAADLLGLLAARAPEKSAFPVEPPEPEPEPAPPPEQQAIRAPQLGFRHGRAPTATLGAPVSAGFVQCGSCHGTGRVRRMLLCHTCGGSGRVARTVEL